jgi:RHS repeat-associated protein
MYKHVWASDDRLGVQRDDGGIQEVKQYFLHKDLQGSTNIVTDPVGDTFQHHEYFPTGEVWVDENSTIFRTPYQYGGGYVDDFRRMIDFGARWYDQNREMFYSPDPVLTDDPMAILDAPALRAAYSYAGANPLTYVDPEGRQFTRAQARAFIMANQDDARRLIRNDPQLRAKLAENLQTRLPRPLVRLALNVETAERRQKVFEAIDEFFVPLVEVNVSTGEVKLGLFVKPAQWTVREGSDGGAKTTKPAASATTPAASATGPTGGPNAPNQAAPQASATVTPSAHNAPVANAATSNDSGAATPVAAKAPPKPLPKPPTKAKGDT